jgi:hypothetical protein
MAPPFGSGLIFTNGIPESGIHGFLLCRILPREGLQIGYRFVEKWGAVSRAQGAWGKARKKR